MSESGSSARVNGRPVTLGVLREIAAALFSIHGQNDNALLLDPKNHVDILDCYADSGTLLEEYKQAYREVLYLRMELESLISDVKEQNRLSDTLRFQIDDIDAVKPKRGEEEALETEANRLRSAERINKCCALVDKALNGGKGMGAIYLTDRAASAMDSVSDALPEAQALAARLSEVRYELEDIASSLRSLSEFGEDTGVRLDKIEARLDAISKLKRKYGSTVEEIMSFRDEAEKKLDLIANAEDRRIELEEKLTEAEKRARSLAVSLTERRRRAAQGLGDSVCETLGFLDMPKVRFEVNVSPTEAIGPKGADSVEFLISANTGEPLMPMAKIASGGELARIMLSLKNVINTADGISTVIFDEIDTGISGKTSRKVGVKLKEIGKTSQVICVTHSAQIASLADSHLYVSKREVEGRTESAVGELSRDGRVCEIARILGGIVITDAQMAAAREMIAEGEKY